MSPHKKTKLISIHILKPSHFRTPQKNHVNSDPCTLIKSISIAHAEVKSISTIHTKTKSRLMLIIKPSDFRPAHKTQGNFDHPHKNQVNRSPHWKQFNLGPHKRNMSITIPTLKPSKFQSIHENQTFTGPNTTKQQDKFRLPPQILDRYPHQNQVNFDPPHKKQMGFDPKSEFKLILYASPQKPR